MTFSDDLRTFALADATISGLIGSRWHPSVLPENPTTPAVTYEVVSAPRMRSHTSSGPVGYRYQLDGWAETAAEAEQLGEAIVARFERYSGAAGNATIDVSLVEDESDRYEESLGLYRRRVDVQVWT